MEWGWGGGGEGGVIVISFLARIVQLEVRPVLLPYTTHKMWLLRHFVPTVTPIAIPPPTNPPLLFCFRNSLSHSYEVGEDASRSVPVTVDLAGIFSGVTLTACTETSLTGNQALATQPKVRGGEERGVKRVSVFSTRIIRLQTRTRTHISPNVLPSSQVTYAVTGGATTVLPFVPPAPAGPGLTVTIQVCTYIYVYVGIWDRATPSSWYFSSYAFLREWWSFHTGRCGALYIDFLYVSL